MTTRRGLLACLLAATTLLSGCGSSTSDPDAPSAPASTELTRLAVVGDSITAADSADLAAGEAGPESWVAHAVGEGLVVADAWAVWGATTAQMARGVEPMEADVLVVLAGTNDVATGVPFDDTAANIAEIVETVGAPRVLLSGVPPLDTAPESAVQLNADLEALALAREWEFVDSSAGLRGEGGVFAEGMSSDGVHPTEAGAQVIGEAVRTALLGGE